MTTDIAEPVIIGIDPGTTAAVAVLDLDGELQGSKSAKNFSKDQIIKFIISHGKPLVIATDVSPAPSLIQDIASNMGTDLHVPDDDLGARYKDELVQEYSPSSTDAHTMDALAAAVNAYHAHEDKILAIQHRLDDAGVERPRKRYDAIELVINGGMATSTAIREVQKFPEDEDSDSNDTTPESEMDWKALAERRKNEIERLEQKVSHLEEYIEMEDANDTGERSQVSEEELRRRNRTISSLRSELERVKSKNEQLDAENSRLRDGFNRLVDGWLYVPRVPDLADAEHDIVYCDSYSEDGVSPVIDTVLTTESLINTPRYNTLTEQGIDLLPIESLDAIELDDGFVVDPETLDASVQEDDTGQRFTEWLDDYRQRQRS